MTGAVWFAIYMGLVLVIGLILDKRHPRGKSSGGGGDSSYSGDGGGDSGGDGGGGGGD